MKPEALTEHLPGIYRAVGQIPLGGPLCMYAAMHMVRAEGAVVMVDPCRLSDSDVKLLEDFGGPTHIILTCANHVRHAEFYRERYQIPIWANRALLSKIQTGVDSFFKDGDELPGGLVGIEMYGMSTGETILVHPAGEGSIIVGDAIFNYLPDDLPLPLKFFGALGLMPKGLSPMPSFVMENKQKAAGSCRKLMDLNFDAIFVSHGSPVLSDAKAKWASVVSGL